MQNHFFLLVGLILLGHGFVKFVLYILGSVYDAFKFVVYMFILYKDYLRMF